MARIDADGLNVARPAGNGLGPAAAWARLSARARSSPWPALGVILLFALGMAAAKLWLDPPAFRFNWDNRWWQIAVYVARGEGYVACKPDYFPFCGPGNHLTAMREPLPVLLLATVAAASDESLLAAAVVAGVLVNLLTLAAVYALARELAGWRAGVLAALMWACYLPPVRLFYTQITGDLLATLCLTAGFAMLLRARQTGRPAHWLAAGAAMGLAILSRSAVLVIAGVVILGLAARPQARPDVQRPAGGAQPALLFAVACALIIGPWFARNYAVFHRPVLGSTLSGYYLLRQNHTLPSGNYLRFVSGGEFAPALQAFVARQPGLRGTENEAEMDALYRAEALRIIASEPGRYLHLSAYRFLMLWFNWGVNAVYNRPDTLGDYATMLQHALLLATGLFGLSRAGQPGGLLAASLAAFSLVYMAVMSHLPYIVPVVPLLVAPSAAACQPLGQRLWRALLPCIRRLAPPHERREHAADP